MTRFQLISAMDIALDLMIDILHPQTNLFHEATYDH